MIQAEVVERVYSVFFPFLSPPFRAQITADRWISSWTQSRLAVPVFAGVGKALQFAIKEGHLGELKEMYAHWPFFRATIDIIEMVLSKSDPDIFQFYESDLVRAVGNSHRG